MTQKTTHEIIDEIANHYNLGNRSENTSGRCLYNGPDNKHCAFAYMCIDSTKFVEEVSARTILNMFGEDILKFEYRGYSIEFYLDIQQLHDLEFMWTETGLSEEGQKYVDKLKSRYPISMFK